MVQNSKMNDWEVSGNLVANNQQLNGASYSGSQLGTSNSAMKFMGTTYCHATVGTGDDNRILMGYSYQPKEVRVELFGWELSGRQMNFCAGGRNCCGDRMVVERESFKISVERKIQPKRNTII